MEIAVVHKLLQQLSGQSDRQSKNNEVVLKKKNAFRKQDRIGRLKSGTIPGLFQKGMGVGQMEVLQ